MSSIFDLLASLESNKNLDSLKKVVRGAVLPHGYDRVVMFSISAVRDELIGGIYWMEGEWFVKSEAVDAQSYLRHCPMTRHVLETDQPSSGAKRPRTVALNTVSSDCHAG